MNRILKFSEALLEAADICLARDPNVYLMGLGAPDPKGIFGTTLGLQQKYGENRVLDIPTSENGMTGVAIGSAIVGMRPILTHQRLDFALLAMEQMVNQAAKWHYMFGGQMQVPLVIRMIIGRGWGQGPQHSQSLQAWFAHVPGLKVVMPATPHDAKGLFIAAVEDNNPVIFLEHRWLHSITGHVPEGHYSVPLGAARTARAGADVTIVAISYMTLEALRAAEVLALEGIEAEVIDLRSIAPLDFALILESVRKTGRLIVADTASQSFGVAAEIIARIVEENPALLKTSPSRVCLPDYPTPTTPALARYYYPRANQIANAARHQLGRPIVHEDLHENETAFLDVPDPSFSGPF
jgi:pyruvate/2-oxoglutarate/acetoin dehydrogenase E1 component